NSKAYKEYYEIATREASPKPKASVRRTRSSSDTSITPPTVAASPRLTASEYAEETRDEESFDSIPQTPKDSEDEGDDEEDLGLNVGEEERHVEEEEEDELYRDV
nr:hypothetical protein [Tanacetum cinerariifolium]